MALKPKTTKAKAGRGGNRRKQKPKDLKLERRVLLYTILFVPLLVAFYGFASLQKGEPNWPTTLQEAPLRGRILAQDGTILAEGRAENREYPQGRLAAHLIGFSGALQEDGRYGLEGLEYTEDKLLQQGEDVKLSIDPNFQAVAQAKLAETIRRTRAENGAVVAIETGTGRILAAASYPDFDPSQQNLVTDRSRITNKAFLHRFEPGSVVKPFVVAALLESGRLTLNELVTTPMSLRKGDKTFYDVAQHEPLLTAWDILRYSSNSGMITLTERFTDWELRSWLQHFGFGKDVSLGSTYTRTGELRDVPWVPQDQASITLGHSMSTTALQLAAAYSIFANDGVYVPPYLIEGQEAAEPHKVLSPEVALTMRRLLTYTAEKSGISHYAVPGMTMAGKTGTGDIFNSEAGQYIKGDYTLTYAAMVPADKPRFTMIVTVQKPRKDDSSTSVAVPLFSDIASEAISLWQLPAQPETIAEQP